MTVKELIQNVEDLKVHLNEVSVYDLDVHTSLDLYYTIAKKFNVVIKELSRFEGVISDEIIKQNEKLIYLLGEGLNTEVVNKINSMVDDGTMDSIINHKLFTDLNSQIKEKANERDLDVERKRIDSFTRLNSGSTTGDAELIDGRIGANGYTYSNIGEAIRNQYKILNEDINNINNGKDTIRFTENDLETGTINYSTGVLENHGTIKRTKNYINLEVGEEITVNVKNGNGVNLIFYDEKDNWKESKSVSATTTTNSRTITVNYPKVKIVFLYYSSSYPLSATNCSIIRELNFKKDIEVDINNIWNFIDGIKVAESTNFNDLVDGAYWLNVKKDTNSLVNAPNNYTYGDFFIISKRTGNCYTQFVFTTINDKNQKRGYFRVFNDTTNIIKWSDLNVMFHKSQDNYVAFGDSITHGYQKTVNGVDTISNYQYWKTVGNVLKLNAVEGANTGSGFVKVQGNKNALRIIEDYDFTDVNLVTLAFGTNDWNGNIPLGTIDDPAINGNVNTNGTYTNDTNTIYSAIKYCVEKILSVDPKITIILITPINRSQVGSSGATLTKEGNWGYGAINTAGYTLGDVCQAIVDVAKYYGLPYIDNREGNPINRLTVKSLTVDGLHPSDWGYMKLGQYYAGKIGSIYRPYEI